MGVRQVQTRFNRLGAAAVDATPAFDTIATLIFGIEKRVFDGQGRRGGGSWKRDSVEWLNRKMRLGLDPRINHATHALRNSVTELGAEGQILQISAQQLIFGSDLPYAKTSQRNRPFIDFTLSDKRMMRNIIRDHLIAAWRA